MNVDMHVDDVMCMWMEGCRYGGWDVDVYVDDGMLMVVCGYEYICG